jgi:hypothetical protein
MKRLLFLLTVLIASLPAIVLAQPTVFEATGQTPADILTTVENFRTALGDDNGGAPGPLPNGRRQINWDGVPDNLADPNLMPANQFRGRGVVFFTPGSGFKVSADSGNPTDTRVRFGSFSRGFVNRFSAFSEERLFTAVDSTITEVLFFIPAAVISQPAAVNGFGVVFTDVNDDDSTKIEYYDKNGQLLFSRNVLRGGRGNLSFLGAVFSAPDVYLVRITSGNRVLPSNNSSRDVVVMDDFIYGEPQAVP